MLSLGKMGSSKIFYLRGLFNMYQYFGSIFFFFVCFGGGGGGGVLKYFCSLIFGLSLGQYIGGGGWLNLFQKFWVSLSSF